MDNGIYIAASRQIALFRDMDTTANNIANLSTIGYQGEHMVFDKYLVDDHVGSKMNFANDIATYRNTQQGTIKITDNPLDLAINGKGYFAVETPLGNRYTRSGNFQINQQGTLVSIEGYPVLNNGNQQITFDADAQNIEVKSNGAIYVNGEEFALMQFVHFENDQLMERAGAKYYISESAPIEIIDEGAIAQGALENSNVAAVQELTHMIKLSKATSSTAKYIEVMYDLQRRNTQTWTQQR